MFKAVDDVNARRLVEMIGLNQPTLVMMENSDAYYLPYKCVLTALQAQGKKLSNKCTIF